MAGFRNIADWASAVDAGKTHVTTFRKTVASAATVANDFVDYTYFAGNPPANFYASSPLEAAFVESSRGIYVPAMAGTDKQFLKSVTAMSLAAELALLDRAISSRVAAGDTIGANILYIRGQAISGTGTSDNPWRPS